MPNVYNWQLGREMAYPYEARFPERQFAFVFNINRCIACQSCTMACKSTWTFSKGQEHMWWANVETKPYGGYPQSWDIKILKMLQEADPRLPGRVLVRDPAALLSRAVVHEQELPASEGLGQDAVERFAEEAGRRVQERRDDADAWMRAHRAWRPTHAGGFVARTVITTS